MSVLTMVGVSLLVSLGLAVPVLYKLFFSFEEEDY